LTPPQPSLTSQSRIECRAPSINAAPTYSGSSGWLDRNASNRRAATYGGQGRALRRTGTLAGVHPAEPGAWRGRAHPLLRQWLQHHFSLGRDKGEGLRKQDFRGCQGVQRPVGFLLGGLMLAQFLEMRAMKMIPQQLCVRCCKHENYGAAPKEKLQALQNSRPGGEAGQKPSTACRHRNSLMNSISISNIESAMKMATFAQSLPGTCKSRTSCANHVMSQLTAKNGGRSAACREGWHMPCVGQRYQAVGMGMGERTGR
jgi:hypothetical protein